MIRERGCQSSSASRQPKKRRPCQHCGVAHLDSIWPICRGNRQQYRPTPLCSVHIVGLYWDEEGKKWIEDWNSERHPYTVEMDGDAVTPDAEKREHCRQRGNSGGRLLELAFGNLLNYAANVPQVDVSMAVLI